MPIPIDLTQPTPTSYDLAKASAHINQHGVCLLLPGDGGLTWSLPCLLACGTTVVVLLLPFSCSCSLTPTSVPTCPCSIACLHSPTPTCTHAGWPAPACDGPSLCLTSCSFLLAILTGSSCYCSFWPDCHSFLLTAPTPTCVLDCPGNLSCYLLLACTHI